MIEGRISDNDCMMRRPVSVRERGREMGERWGREGEKVDENEKPNFVFTFCERKKMLWRF